MIIRTRPWRRRLAGYLHENGLPSAGHAKGEAGWTTETNRPFGKPARHVIKRVSNNLEARGIIRPQDNDGTLNSHVQAALNPPLTPGERAVAYALTQLGTHESPWGSNRGADVHRYQSSTGAYNAAWCASFFWYCWQKAGYTGVTSAGAWNTTDFYGAKILSIKYAKTGDGVSFNIGDGHIGQYLSHTATMVKTIDGNTNDQVAIRERPIYEIHSINRPHV